jgi:hypothetical protein
VKCQNPEPKNICQNTQKSEPRTPKDQNPEPKSKQKNLRDDELPTSEPKTIELSWREQTTGAKKESKALRLRSEKEKKRKKQGLSKPY